MRTITRRQFLGEASCAAIGSTSILSTLLNLTMTNHAAAASGGIGGTRKSLVCLYLNGGCDSFNFLIPMDQPGDYDDYAASRSNLAIPRGDLIPLNFTDSFGRSFGVHPSCPRIAEMFNGMGGNTSQRCLSFLANIGTLVEPIPDKNAYLSKMVDLPKALFSHRDQTEQWQTSVPQGMSVVTGWAGRAADIIHSTLNTEQTGSYYMPMNYSLSGNSTFQIGESEGQFAITSDGALTFEGSESSRAAHLAKNAAISAAVESPLEQHYRNLFQQTHGQITNNSIARGQEFQNAYDSPGSLNGVDVEMAISASSFPDSRLSRNFQSAVRTIAIRSTLRLNRQTIFIEYGGWDHHNELLINQAGMLSDLDATVYAFQTCLSMLGLGEDVITFSASDFGRTLRSNGQGTDHAWSANQFVFGGPVAGGQICGRYPSLAIDGADDIGRGGRIFPEMSVDEYFCELLRWFGVTNGDMDQVLPNIRNFYDPASSSNPVGFLV